MEAENFLANGFGIRLSVEGKLSGWCRLSGKATVWQPSRLKGIQVDPEFGTPFLAATQVFDTRPVPRKWISLDRTSDHAERVVRPGTILVTCSGSVGRATIAHASTSGVLVSHDLLRIEAKSPEWRGWVYAYLRAPSVRSMMWAAQYGHIIKHLETHHLESLPFVEPRYSDTLDVCNDKLKAIIESRNSALRKITEAENIFEEYFGVVTDLDGKPFARRASETLFSRRRRFDAWSHNPQKLEVETKLKSSAVAWSTLREVGCDVWLPNRFKRVPAEEGIALIDSSQIFELNPDYIRRISAEGISDKNNGYVKPGWLMMSRSGQVYGLLGSVVVATEQHEGKLVSDDVMRINPGDGISSGYLYVAMSHSKLGRPRTKSLAYGSSIPHIEVEDLKNFAVPRLAPEAEDRIGNLAEEAFALWAKADEAENVLADLAESEIERFLHDKDNPARGA